MSVEKMFEIFERCIRDYHLSDDVDATEQNPYPSGSLEALLYSKNWIDTVQWHLEDIIRDPEIDANKALEIKRRIDASNQVRTDMVEKIDDYFMDKYSDVEVKPVVRLNTESPAWALDRYSILALKIYHMGIEAERTDIEAPLLEKNRFKHKVLLEQKTDLTISITQLLEDIENGERVMKVYRQMKMYNDPELNPVLYAQNKQ